MTEHPNPSCVVKVGAGRGFIIEQRTRTPKSLANWFGNRVVFVKKRLVLTAAHCLPKLPPAHPCALFQERTYPNLLGRLDGKSNEVWTECLFVDPIADIAVLGCPDRQELYEESEAYDALTDDAPALLIGKAQSGKGWVLALDGAHWIPTKLRLILSPHGTSLAIGPTKTGMSGSPIMSDRGRAVGVVSVGSETWSAGSKRRIDEESRPQPILTRDLPGRLLQL